MATPARIGIIDMGSNAIRLLIAEADETGRATILDSQRDAVQLGREVFESGRIADSTITAAVEACCRFRSTCDQALVTDIRAVATAAVREAENRSILAQRVREATGIELEVISGMQEAHLLKLGIESRLDLSHGRSLLVDVGGGSVEIVMVEAGNVVTADSYPLGALRLLSAFAAAKKPSESLSDLVNRHLHNVEPEITDRFDSTGINLYVAVGGNIECLADLVAARDGTVGSEGIDRVDLDALGFEVDNLAAMTVEQRMAAHDLRPDRAEIIVPAGIVYAWLGRLAAASTVLVPRCGIKEGLLASVANGDWP